jgi:hypothetical protein
MRSAPRARARKRSPGLGVERRFVMPLRIVLATGMPAPLTVCAITKLGRSASNGSAANVCAARRRRGRRPRAPRSRTRATYRPAVRAASRRRPVRTTAACCNRRSSQLRLSACLAAESAASQTEPSSSSPSPMITNVTRLERPACARERQPDADRQAVAERAGRRFDAGNVRVGMTAQQRARRALHAATPTSGRKEALVREHRVERQAAVTFAQDAAVALGPARFVAAYAQHVVVEHAQNFDQRERRADVSAPAADQRIDDTRSTSAAAFASWRARAAGASSSAPAARRRCQTSGRNSLRTIKAQRKP